MHVLPALVAAVLVSQAATLATSIYLHRTLSHRALTMRPGLALGFRGLVWITTGIVPRDWVAVHRRHHATSDTVADPHSPVVLGFWRVQLGNVALYRRAIRDGVTVRRYARDLQPDGLDRALFDHSLVGLSIGIGILCLLLGWQTGLLAAALHTVIYLATSAAINAVGHSFGRRPYPNLATNNQWLALLSAGEGLHNNHHAAPTSARFALDPGQVDPSWWFIRVFLRLRLAAVRHDEVKLKQAA